MTRDRRWMFAGALGVFAASACSSLEGLSGDAAEGATDGGSSVTDASPSTADAAALDGAIPQTGTFCERERARSPAPLLCSDFEAPFVLDGVWDQTAMSKGGTLVREESAAPAFDRGHLKAKTPFIGGGDEAEALVFKYLTKRLTKATLGFDLRIGMGCSASGLGTIALANVGQGDPGKKWIASINFRPGGLVFNTNACTGSCDGTEHTLASPPAPGNWARIELHVDLATAKVRVTIDQKPSYEGSMLVVSDTTDEVLLNVGNNVTGQVSECEMEFDDVLFSAE